MRKTYFVLEEFLKTSTGLDNTPNGEQLENLKEVMKRMHYVREAVGKPCIITSGFRSPAVNKAVGGVPTSHHAQGWAADFVCYRDPIEACEKILKAGVKFDQLIAEYKKGAEWIHISFHPQMRGQVLTYRNRKYLPGLVREDD